MKLDVSRLPRHADYGPTGDQVDMADVVLRSRTALTALKNRLLLKRNDSFGFAAALPGEQGNHSWKDPYHFTWFVVGWGPQGDKYIANAVRKLRPVLRTEMSTLELRVRNKGFKKRVDSQESDGSFKWGDFPWGGGVLVPVANLVIPCAVSCFAEVEDHAIALMAGGLIGSEMLKRDTPSEFGPQS